MAELDDCKVAALRSIDERLEPALFRVASGTPSSNGHVYDRDGQVLCQKLAPSCVHREE